MIGIIQYTRSRGKRVYWADELGHSELHRCIRSSHRPRDLSEVFVTARWPHPTIARSARPICSPQNSLCHGNREKDATQLGEISLHDDGALRHLAKRYGVSLQAILIRLTSLRLLEHAALA